MKIYASDVVVHGRFWRFVQFPVTRIVIAALGLAIMVLLLQWTVAVTQFKPHSMVDGALATVVTIAALIAMDVAYVGLVERNSKASYRRAVLAQAGGHRRSSSGRLLRFVRSINTIP